MSGFDEDGGPNNAETGLRAEAMLRSALSSARLELPDTEAMSRMETKIASAIHGGSDPSSVSRAGLRALSGAIVLGMAAIGVLVWISMESSRPISSTTRGSTARRESSAEVATDASASTATHPEATHPVLEEPAERESEESELPHERFRRHGRRASQRERAQEQASAPEPASPHPPTDEISLVRAARRALAREPEHALRLVERHRREFADGILAEEREVLAVEALAALGRRVEAEQRAHQFRAQWGQSPYRARIDAALTRP